MAGIVGSKEIERREGEGACSKSGADRTILVRPGTGLRRVRCSIGRGGVESNFFFDLSSAILCAVPYTE